MFACSLVSTVRRTQMRLLSLYSNITLCFFPVLMGGRREPAAAKSHWRNRDCCINTNVRWKARFVKFGKTLSLLHGRSFTTRFKGMTRFLLHLELPSVYSNWNLCLLVEYSMICMCYADASPRFTVHNSQFISVHSCLCAAIVDHTLITACTVCIIAWAFWRFYRVVQLLECYLVLWLCWWMYVLLGSNVRERM